MQDSKENEIRAIAHRIWVEQGCPDGEQLVYGYGENSVKVNGNSMIKLKDLHWQVAVVEWTYGPDYLRSW